MSYKNSIMGIGIAMAIMGMIVVVISTTIQTNDTYLIMNSYNLGMTMIVVGVGTFFVSMLMMEDSKE